MKNTQIDLANQVIDFFATIYDLVIELFANIYDSGYNLVIFIGEYIKWMTTVDTNTSTQYSTHGEDAIHVHN